MIPPDPALADDPDEALDRIDGLILAGGHDVDPSFYGADPHPATTRTVPERDRIEIALARRAIERDMPLLGICRGMQVLNVAFGGTLLQHLPEVFGHDDHLRTRGTFDGSDHDVVLARRLARGARRRRATAHDQVPPPPGRRRDRRRPDRDRHLDARRAPRGDRAPGPPVRARRPVAPRGRREQPRDRRARDRGAGLPEPRAARRSRPRGPRA